MNELSDNDPAESLLASLRPAPLSPDLMKRLVAARPAATAPVAAPSRPKIIQFLPRLASAAAVFVVTAGGMWLWQQQGSDQGTPIVGNPPATPPSAPADATPPVPQETRQQLLGMRDLGITRDAQSRPVRLMQATWLDDNIYHPANGAPPVRESRVRDEIVPVVLTTY